MKNRTVIGIVCIVLALIITFAVAPLVNKLADSRVDIVRLTKDVARGHMISDDDVEIITVGAYNLPNDVITAKESAVGMFAACDLVAGDYLLPGKLTIESDNAEDVFGTLTEGNQAVSVTIMSFAGGFSGKIENGDIIRLYVFDGETKEVNVPPELQYVRVITTTTADGNDKDEIDRNEDGTYTMPTTMTLLVNETQAKCLVSFENKDTIHAALICRGDSKRADTLLAEQNQYFLNPIEPEVNGNG